ncbi:CIC11C00000005572 [Sungouiella intermedia]|uniref:CIC11C00000005572 n=1 Tax=Sungouiella intermedia TaxID=45354 RepID=A0A1L0BH98_9ASCO|nr:CIC11C00000005572 [[Candida] intermedia]
MDQLVLEFKNGDDIHFNYSSQAETALNTAESGHSSKKKKSKKKKKKSGASTATTQFTMSDATLNDPDADYPESRVIKFDADGNVVVESLDEDYGTERINSHPQTRAVEPVKHTKFSVFHFNNDDEKKFWDNLSLHAQRDIVDLSPYTVIQKIREQMKHRLASHTGCDHKPDKLCNCPYCNRGSLHIEEIVEALYHLDVHMICRYVEDFKQEIFPELKMNEFHRDLLFDEEEGVSGSLSTSALGTSKEHDQILIDTSTKEKKISPKEKKALQKRERRAIVETEQQEMSVRDADAEQELKAKGTEESIATEGQTALKDHESSNGHDSKDNVQIEKKASTDTNALREETKLALNEVSKYFSQITLDHTPAEEEGSEVQEKELIWSRLKETDRDHIRKIFRTDFAMEAKLRSRMKFVNGLKEELMERYKDPSRMPKDVLDSLKFEDNSNATDNYSMEILNSLGFFTGDDSENQVAQASDKINAFADLILNDDGRYFLDILESLIKKDNEKGSRIEELEEDNPELEHYALKSPITDEVTHQDKGYDARPSDPASTVHTLEATEGVNGLPRQDVATIREQLTDHHGDFLHEHHHNCNHHDDQDEDGEDEYASEYDEDYDYHHDCEHHQNCDHDCHHDCDHDEHYDDESEQESDEESEYSKQKRKEEIRGFFLIQAVSMIRQNFREAYEKKISEDRTQKFIEELEAEENAKKEKEMKKLKQKEKQKEKKRLQQLQKEEEKKRKEAEELEKAIEIKRKQDELRAEQMRRKEELRLKKEEEKLKKIEALKKKELEQQKLAQQKLKQQEEQRKKDAEKKAEEEKAAEEERKAKEAERRAKEEERKVKETERRAKEAERNTLEAKLNFSQLEEQIGEEELHRGPPPGLSAPEIKPQEPAPANNHILDQLYQARPRSVSSTSSFTQQIPSLTSSLYSPTKQQIQQATWATDTTLNLQSQPLPTQNSNVFSPFGEPTTGGDQWSTGQMADPFLTSNSVLPNRASTSGNSVWGGAYASRNNSIWNSNPATGAGASTIWSSPVPQNAGLMVGAISTLGPDVQESSLIQAATCDAFQTLQSSNQVSFGMAPAVLLFQTTKALLKHTSLGMAEFLGTLRTGGRYQFDFVYDDFGSVTHIKVNSLNANSTPPLSMHASLQLQIQPQLPSLGQNQPLQGQTLQGQSLQGQSLPGQSLQGQSLPGQSLPGQSLQIQTIPTQASLLPPNLPIHQNFQPQAQPLSQPQLVQGVAFQQAQFSDNGEIYGTNFQTQSSGPKEHYDINLPASVQGLLNQLGFGQSRGSIW